jgi:hypothetical protein
MSELALATAVTPAMEDSVRDALRHRVMPARELGAESGVTRTTIDAMAWHGHKPRPERSPSSREH